MSGPQPKDIRAHGYNVKVASEYHWIVTKPGSSIRVNVWPTAKKILKKYSPGPAPHYTSLVKALEQEFKPVEFEEAITPQQQGAVDLLHYYKDNWAMLLKNQVLFKEYLQVI